MFDRKKRSHESCKKTQPSDKLIEFLKPCRLYNVYDGFALFYGIDEIKYKDITWDHRFDSRAHLLLSIFEIPNIY